jgi:hypothetical protein
MRADVAGLRQEILEPLLIARLAVLVANPATETRQRDKRDDDECDHCPDHCVPNQLVEPIGHVRGDAAVAEIFAASLSQSIGVQWTLIAPFQRSLFQADHKGNIKDVIIHEIEPF